MSIYNQRQERIEDDDVAWADLCYRNDDRDAKGECHSQMFFGHANHT